MMMMTLSQEELPSIFSDVTPIPQDDGPNPVCAIDYSPQFIQAYDYMRAVLALGEKTERTLRLTGLCLKLNPANYTIWHYRRQCLESILATNSSENETLAAELIPRDLELAATLGGDNPKNYQIWYHRRALLESLLEKDMKDYVAAELEYVAQVLTEDSKNYHAWSHRQWVVRTVNEDSLWEKELEFAHSLIQKDPRNNSAWNQRWFVCHKGATNNSNAALTLETAKREADYAIQGAGLDPFNESPWRYLIGVLREQCRRNHHHPSDPHDKDKLLDEYEQKAFGLRDVLEKADKNPDSCASLTSARIDILEFKGDPSSLEKAVELASGLATEHDPIRKKYWLLRVDEMKRELSK